MRIKYPKPHTHEVHVRKGELESKRKTDKDNLLQ
jgi:hypothetical protein